MPYVAPLASSLNLVFTGAYAAPAGGGVVFDFALAADPGGPPGVTDSAVAAFQGLARGATAVRRQLAATWTPPLAARPTLRAAYAQKPEVSVKPAIAWGVSARKTPGVRGSWVSPFRLFSAQRLAFRGLSTPFSPRLGSAWKAPVSRQISDRVVYPGKSQTASVRVVSAYISPSPKRLCLVTSYALARVAQLGCRARFGQAAVRSHAPWMLVFKQGHAPVWSPQWPGHVFPPSTPGVAVRSADLLFACARPQWTPAALDLVFLASGCPWYTPPIIVIGSNNIVLNTMSVVRLPDRTPIYPKGVRLQLDQQSWAWGVNLELAGAADMALVSPVAGNPVAVEISINGYVWTALIEQYNKSQLFGEIRYQAIGRSTAAALAAPFAPIRSASNTASQVAAQLCAAELLNTGWSLSYHASISQLMTVDWTVPIGAWSYQDKTPMEALGLIAGAIGARVYAARNTQTLYMAPKYPVSPWDWGTATPDATIAASLITNIGGRLEPKPIIDQVFVSGQNQGVLVSGRRLGTAGNNVAKMVVDPLITVVGAGRERCRNILSTSGKQELVNVEIPLVASPGLIEPGALAQVSDGAQTWRGLATQVVVTAAFGEVHQVVEIERHY